MGKTFGLHFLLLFVDMSIKCDEILPDMGR